MGLQFSDEVAMRNSLDGRRSSSGTGILQYVILKDGLDINRAVEVAADAAVECYRKLIRRIDTEAKINKKDNQHHYARLHNKWGRHGGYKKVINGGNQFTMESLLNSIPDDIVTHAVDEFWYTGEGEDDILCIVVGPDIQEKLDDILKKFKLI